eukprot:7426327-Alexandrium_andersonii.AAC.1
MARATRRASRGSPSRGAVDSTPACGAGAQVAPTEEGLSRLARGPLRGCRQLARLRSCRRRAARG